MNRPSLPTPVAALARRVRRSLGGPRFDRVTTALRVISPAGWVVVSLFVGGWACGWLLGWREGLWIAAGSGVVLLLAAFFLFGSTDLEVEVDVQPRRVTVGDASSGRLLVRNVGSRLFPLRMELVVGRVLAVFDIPSLASRAEHQELFVLPTSRRQVMPVGPARSVRGDPLGLTRRTVDWTEPVDLFIHPRIRRLENLGAGFLRDLEGQPTSDLSNNDIAFHALREYQPGDDRRFVHWKTTARVGKLMVRQFVDTRRSHLAVLLDTLPDGYASDDEFELAVSLAGSLGARALLDEQEVTFTTGDGPVGAVDGRQLLDGLARVELSSSAEDLTRQAAEIVRSRSGISIVVLVAGSAMPLAEIRSAANRFGESVRLLVLRAHVGGASGMKPVGSATVLNVGDLDEFPHLMWKVTNT